jgi:hypothetical protein
MGVNLVSYATRRGAGMEAREAADVVNDFGRDPIGEGQEERVRFNLTLPSTVPHFGMHLTNRSTIGSLKTFWKTHVITRHQSQRLVSVNRGDQVLSNPAEMRTGNEKGLSSKSSRGLRWSRGFGELPMVIAQLQIENDSAIHQVCKLSHET